MSISRGSGMVMDPSILREMWSDRRDIESWRRSMEVNYGARLHTLRDEMVEEEGSQELFIEDDMEVEVNCRDMESFAAVAIGVNATYFKVEAPDSSYYTFIRLRSAYNRDVTILK